MPGGGVALLRAQAAVLDASPTASSGDEATGARMVAKSLEAPLKQIAENAGMEGGVVVERVQEPDAATRASTPPPATTRTSSRSASSTPPR